MPGYQTHFSVGIALTIVLGAVLILLGYIELSLVNVGTILAISFVYSLLPDIDIGTSIIRKVAVISFVVYLFINGLDKGVYIIGILLILIQFLHHRKIMHSFFTGIVLAGLLFVNFSWPFALIALVNFFSHLYLDRH